MTTKKTGNDEKFFRALDKKAAVSEAETLKKANLKKTMKLRELRLAKEAEERAAEAANPKPKKKTVKKKKVPPFDRDT